MKFWWSCKAFGRVGNIFVKKGGALRGKIGSDDLALQK